MIDEILQKREPRRIKGLNIVPILDMLTTVIFFLLMSTSFMEYTKLTIPPSSTRVRTDSVSRLPPLSPKLLMSESEKGYRITLAWGGSRPGEAFEQVSPGSPEELRKSVFVAGRKLSKDFSRAYPAEKAVQMGLGAKVPYQHLITLMDGVREALPDVVLISYQETGTRSAEGAP